MSVMEDANMKLLNIRAVTYNVHFRDPESTSCDIKQLLDIQRPPYPDLIFFGLQEMNYWPSQLVNDWINNDLWTDTCTRTLGPLGYVRLRCIRMLGTHLSVYVLRQHLHHFNGIEVQTTPTGWYGYLGNKGSVSIRFDVYGANMCVVNSHFTPHDKGVRYRNMDFLSAVTKQTFQSFDTPKIPDHDYVVWMGDLNYRLNELSRDAIDKFVKSRDWSELLKYDQLSEERQQERVFANFVEAEIKFPPTYKFDIGNDVYDTSIKARRPAWTDRILYLAHCDRNLGLSVDRYFSQSQPKCSDHRAVVAYMQVKVPPGFPPPMVSFQHIDNWDCARDGVFAISCSPDLPRSTWDYVVLYRDTLRHLADYETYIYVESWIRDSGALYTRDGARLYTLKISHRYLRDCSGIYCLAYHSAIRGEVVGWSNWFQVSLTISSDEDDEETVTESDDSEIGPMQPLTPLRPR